MNNDIKVESFDILDMLDDLSDGNKEVIEFLKDNYEKLINKRKKSFLFVIVKVLLEIGYTKEIVESKMLYNFLVADLYEFKGLMTLKISEQIIKENFEELINKIDMDKIFVIVEDLKPLTEEQKKVLNKVLENRKKDYLKYLLASKIEDMKIEEKDLNDFLEIVCKIVDELLLNEKKEIIEMELLNSGFYSVVFQIGNKVLKIGEKRETYNIPYTNRLLQPLIRVNLKDISNINGTIEVSDKVDTNVRLTDEQLYEFYKELRDEGIIFADIKNSNLGILLDKNEKHWGKNIARDHKAEGIISNEEEDRPLDKGDIVIIDTDFLYSDEVQKIYWAQPKAREFEHRYQNELFDEIMSQNKKF